MSFCIPFTTDGGPANPSQTVSKWVVSEETSFFQLQAHVASFITWPFKTAALQEAARNRFEAGESNLEPYRIVVKKSPQYTCIAAGSDWERISLTWRYVVGTLTPQVEKAVLTGHELVPYVVNEVVTRFIGACVSPGGGPSAMPPKKIEGTLTRFRDIQTADANVLLVLKAELDKAEDPDFETILLRAAVQQRLYNLKMAELPAIAPADLDREINRLEIGTQVTERFLLPHVKYYYAKQRAQQSAETTDPSGKQMFAFSSEILGWVGSCQDKELLESFLEAVKGRIATLERLEESAKEKAAEARAVAEEAVVKGDSDHGGEDHCFCPLQTVARVLEDNYSKAVEASKLDDVAKANAHKAEEEATAKKKAEEEAAAKKAEEEAAAKKKAEEEAAAKKAEEEAAAKKKAEEEAAAKKKEEEEAAAKKKAEEEAAAKKKAEEEAAAKKKEEEEAAATKKAEEEAAVAKKAEEDGSDDGGFEDAADTQDGWDQDIDLDADDEEEEE